ncbi:HAMP domain-containing sensor histidine kinase [Bacillus sp. 165]|uniref:HAMP domain-containing sensor histidine kinase n=1 Tax=Bacillus sp. 165 TaxID=1529117 RepID=UPI001AD9C90A|nr:HAMP domain-containing sensor histidine kinase [Bacillus sp. 165]MBO9131171.1 HAMP domain-containing histidine kinase [Bacillus sp. 165]
MKSFKKTIVTRLNMKLIVIFIICFFFSVTTVSIASRNVSFFYKEYVEKQQNLSFTVNQAGQQIEESLIHSQNKEAINHILKPYAQDTTIILADGQGNILYKTKNVTEDKVDISRILKQELGIKQKYEGIDNSLMAVYPISFSKNILYLIMKSAYAGEYTSVEKIQEYNRSIFLLVGLGVLVFMASFFLLMNPTVRYIKEIELGIRTIAMKNWDYTIRIRGKDELSSLAKNINYMANELQEKFQKERQIEQTKTELIANMSHDLRTPLTSIIGYLNLLQMKQYKSEKEQEEYIFIAYNTAQKLKHLMNELFEYTKLSQPDITMDIQEVELGVLLHQFVGEYVPIFEKKDLYMRINIPEHPVMVMLDIEKMVRVLDNLLSNAEKYSHRPSELILEMKEKEEEVIISLSNQTDSMDTEEVEKLFERFYRRDRSRSENISGSGIGLAVAKRIIDLHGGKIWAESHHNVFSVYITLCKQ